MASLTVLDLRSATPIVSTGTLVVETTGYATDNDGGGGVFVWSSVPDTDDGGTIIVPGGAIGVVGSCWKRAYSDEINVKWFGATGDGITDDSISISNAVTMIGASNALLRVPLGTYVIGGSISIPANIGLVIDKGAVFSVSVAKTLTINGNIAAQPGLIFSGAGSIDLSTSRVSEVYAEWWGAIPDNSTDCSTAIQSALDTHCKVILNYGTYLIKSAINITSIDCYLEGINQMKTYVRCHADLIGTAIDMSSCSNINLKSFRLVGTTAVQSGVSLGNAGGASYSINLEDLYIEGFSGANMFGIQFQNCWWIDVRKCSVIGCNYGLYVPVNDGICGRSTITIRHNCIIDLNTVGAQFDGTVADLVMDRVTFEGNPDGAIVSVGQSSNLVLRHCYFEVNADAGKYIIDVDAPAGGYKFATVTIERCFFHGTTGGKCLHLGYVASSVVSYNDGLFTHSVETEITTKCVFIANKGHQGADPIDEYSALLGEITAQDEHQITAHWFGLNNGIEEVANGTRTFIDCHLRSTQTTAPTCNVYAAAGTAATASLSNATDIKGVLTLDFGNAAYGVGDIVDVTFDTAYAVAPIVILTPANANAGGLAFDKGMHVASWTTKFVIKFDVAEAAPNQYKWFYMVIA